MQETILKQCVISRDSCTISLYFHIPFCVSKCHYCDFNSVGMGTSKIPETAYVQTVLQEAQRWEQVLVSAVPRSIPSVFFGGGTPSLFSAEAIASLLAAGQRLGQYAEDIELTLEMNPKTATLEKIRAYRAAGLNRISIGVQSLEANLLKPLNRAHSVSDALQTLRWVIDGGFDNYNVDLMYGLPQQSSADLHHTFAQLQDYPLAHLSLYELIIEEGTPFYDQHHQGRLLLPSEEEILAMEELLADFALSKGLSPYEISNFSKPDQACRHNLRYWNYESFIGLGAGAVSFLRRQDLAPSFWLQLVRAGRVQENSYGLRFTNPRPLDSYQAHVHDGSAVELESISVELAMGEFMMMGLRKTEGIRYLDFEQCFGQAFPASFQDLLKVHAGKGRIDFSDEGCHFTPTGKNLSNEVLKDFIDLS